ncbi:MAG: hypothetical protein EZS28_035448 [Streblomastix strix]|uniref:Uncharacterized protein n=1 Tax=Streblomastix strix TaxID=222440 RepID=A0A5J4UHL1_9EUKA|nr:MAG: hypothetical protein EZS28_035448 [Streblomastix strix]
MTTLEQYKYGKVKSNRRKALRVIKGIKKVKNAPLTYKEDLIEDCKISMKNKYNQNIFSNIYEVIIPPHTRKRSKIYREWKQRVIQWEKEKQNEMVIEAQKQQEQKEQNQQQGEKNKEKETGTKSISQQKKEQYDLYSPLTQFILQSRSQLVSIPQSIYPLYFPNRKLFHWLSDEEQEQGSEGDDVRHKRERRFRLERREVKKMMMIQAEKLLRKKKNFNQKKKEKKDQDDEEEEEEDDDIELDIQDKDVDISLNFYEWRNLYFNLRNKRLLKALNDQESKRNAKQDNKEDKKESDNKKDKDSNNEEEQEDSQEEDDEGEEEEDSNNEKDKDIDDEEEVNNLNKNKENDNKDDEEKEEEISDNEDKPKQE